MKTIDTFGGMDNKASEMFKKIFDEIWNEHMVKGQVRRRRKFQYRVLRKQRRIRG